MEQCHGYSGAPSATPNLPHSYQLLRDGFGAEVDGVLLQYFKYDPGQIRTARQRVLQQLPHRFGHAPVVRIHPEPLVPGSAGDVYLDNPIERHTVDRLEWVEAVVHRVAVNVVQVEQLETAAPLDDCAHESDFVADLRGSRQAREVVCRVLQQERHAVPLANGDATRCHDTNGLLGGRKR